MNLKIKKFEYYNYVNFTSKYFGFAGPILFIFLFIIGCAPGRFERTPNPRCTSDTGECNYDETLHLSGGLVDILFVNDNSGSMSFEQSKMGERFPMMLQKLDARTLDYRIGITTTDISSSNNPPRVINQNGALQNGRLITYANSSKVLEPNTPDKYNLFLSAMKRTETIACEDYMRDAYSKGISQISSEYQIGYYNNCPSGDERGIAAAVRSIRYNQDQLIRPEAHLAVVIISDENERSWGITDPTSPYFLSVEDMPQTLIDTVKQIYPNKTLSVHSVVIKSNDYNCLNIQNAQLGGFVKGQFGTIYEELSKATNGVIGSVCESDYGTQMGKIGSAIVQQVEYFAVHCEDPINFEVIFDPASSAVGYQLVGKRVVFDKPLDPSIKVRFRYQCPIID